MAIVHFEISRDDEGKIVSVGCYFIFLFFLVVCILNVLTSSWHYVVAEAGCNRYLLGINIFPLLKKKVLRTTSVKLWMLLLDRSLCDCDGW
jgi:hypothetical protein